MRPTVLTYSFALLRTQLASFLISDKRLLHSRGKSSRSAGMPVALLWD
jgi:hypothetical protein